MATVLRSIFAAVAAVTLAISTSNVLAPVASAQSQVQGWFTGYAFGNAAGPGGPVSNGDFGNHNPTNCPDDPSSYWAFGAQISVVNPSFINEHNEWGSTTGFVWFTLRDTGDLSCSQGNYWADIYFGRHKQATEPCDCTGSPSPGVCVNDQGGYTGNACTDAINWGIYWATYWSP